MGYARNSRALHTVNLVASAAEASIFEIFASRQGEGICVGDPQIFVRFGGCNVVCDYCDTPESIPAKSGALWSLEAALSQIDLFQAASKTVSLTGGEPLLQVGFLERFIPGLRARNCKVYLETNGTLPRALERVVEGCDWVAMDLKPESAIGRDMWEAHRWFLETGGKKIFVKMVLTRTTRVEELQRAVDLINGVRPETPLVLQPATAWGQASSIPLERLVSFWNLATEKLSDVRILPQIHRLWQIP